ncbi:TetR/AcrR family transcriptional regulator C-terminal domain-containing protein [Nakamurella sp. A5-74]|uniref:TetR/AcrR family transcriptional regulator C-terminal domain-containing protein n=1 Tax=Nakamurella sp. A5-74 TaxID=3158264 RepID=A0AAU8DPN9_9ACTN
MSPGRTPRRGWDVAPGESGFPFPPWHSPTPVARPRASLSRERIVAVALAIVDAESTEAVTMRRIATDLDTGAASLYAYVSGKDEVLSLAHDAVLANLRLPPGPDDDWRQLVRDWARATQQLYSAHQDLARLSFATIPTSTAGMDIAERLFAAMVRGGVPSALAAQLLDRLALYIGADVFEGWLYGQRFRATDPADTRTTEQRAQEFFVSLGAYFKQMPADRYPTVSAHVDDLMAGDGQERFEFGIELMIAGVDKLAERMGEPPPEG